MWLFQHQNKGKQHHLQGNFQVYNVRIPVEMPLRPGGGGEELSLLQTYGCGSKPMVPFWGSLFQGGLGCSRVRDFDPWPYVILQGQATYMRQNFAVPLDEGQERLRTVFRRRSKLHQFRTHFLPHHQFTTHCPTRIEHQALDRQGQENHMATKIKTGLFHESSILNDVRQTVPNENSHPQKCVLACLGSFPVWRHQGIGSLRL